MITVDKLEAILYFIGNFIGTTIAVLFFIIIFHPLLPLIISVGIYDEYSPETVAKFIFIKLTSIIIIPIIGYFFIFSFYAWIGRIS